MPTHDELMRLSGGCSKCAAFLQRHPEWLWDKIAVISHEGKCDAALRSTDKGQVR